MATKRNRRLLEKYEKGLCSDQENAIIDKFFELFDEEGGQLRNWNPEERDRIGRQIYANVKKAMNKQPVAGNRRLLTLAKYAAVLLVVAGLGWLLHSRLAGPEYMTASTGTGERRTVTLSDGSTVELNAESSLSFPRTFGGRNREVQLSGEGFFHVTKDPKHPFIIHSGELQTTVLGTSFNIMAYPDDPVSLVSVATGKVRVRMAAVNPSCAPAMPETILLPNEQAYYQKSDQLLQKQTIGSGQLAAWRQGLIVLDGLSLRNASKVLERWYHVDFRIEDEEVGRTIINGEFRYDTIINVLENIKFLTGIDYQFTSGNTVVITKGQD
jgi:ferric-dicitrate binding protein FerR (iron transport regulator)